MYWMLHEIDQITEYSFIVSTLDGQTNNLYMHLAHKTALLYKAAYHHQVLYYV